jgi:hypothetical protein
VADLTTIAGKLGSLVRLVASDKDGEVVAAARAITRTLKSAGADIHALADRVEHANGSGKISEADMRKLFDAGYAAGIAAAESRDVGDDFHNLDGSASWETMAAHCRRRRDQLNEREQEFISSALSRIVYREPMEKQAKWLRSIFLRTGGRLR